MAVNSQLKFASDMKITYVRGKVQLKRKSVGYLLYISLFLYQDVRDIALVFNIISYRVVDRAKAFPSTRA